MALWLAFFAEYNFTVEYKPGKANVLADALSRRPDLEAPSKPVLEVAVQAARVAVVDSDVELRSTHVSEVSTALRADIQRLYAADAQCQALLDHFAGRLSILPAPLAARAARFSLADGLLWYHISDCDYPRVVVPHDDDLKSQILSEFHSTPTAGHLGREKTYLSAAAHFWWPHMYKWVAHYVKTCSVCQRVKASPSIRAPLCPLPIPSDCWESVSMDFVFGYPRDTRGNTGVLVFVDRLSKMVHLVPVRKSITATQCAQLFVEHVFRLHGMPRSIVSDRDPRFTATFWVELFKLLGSALHMSTADHPESDGQTERVNRVVEDILRSFCAEHPRRWSALLPMAEFAINNAVHASHGATPFYVNGLRHPRVPALFGTPVPTLSGGGSCAHDGVYHDTLVDEPLEVTPGNQAGSLPLGNYTGNSHAGNLVGKYPLGKYPSVKYPGGIYAGKYDGKYQSDSYPSSDSESDSPADAVSESSDFAPASDSDASLDAQSDDDMEVGAMLQASSALVTRNARHAQAAQDFVALRASVLMQVRDNLAEAQAKQKLHADRHGRRNTQMFTVGQQVLLKTTNLPKHAFPEAASVHNTKLQPRWIGPFTVVDRVGSNSYRLALPQSMRVHPTFYVGMLKPYHAPHGLHTEDHPPRSTGPAATRLDSTTSPAAADTAPSAPASPAEHADQMASPSSAAHSSMARHTTEASSSTAPSVHGAHAPSHSRAAAAHQSQPHFAADSDASSDGATRAQDSHSSPTCLRTTRARSRGMAAPQPPDARPSDVGNNAPRYEVEAIVKHRGQAPHRFFLVKWSGYAQRTWEPEAHIAVDVPSLLRQYLADRQLVATRR